jgi:hypothetical protein
MELLREKAAYVQIHKIGSIKSRYQQGELEDDSEEEELKLDNNVRTNITVTELDPVWYNSNAIIFGPRLNEQRTKPIYIHSLQELLCMSRDKLAYKLTRTRSLSTITNITCFMKTCLDYEDEDDNTDENLIYEELQEDLIGDIYNDFALASSSSESENDDDKRNEKWKYYVTHVIYCRTVYGIKTTPVLQDWIMDEAVELFKIRLNAILRAILSQSSTNLNILFRLDIARDITFESNYLDIKKIWLKKSEQQGGVVKIGKFTPYAHIKGNASDREIDRIINGEFLRNKTIKDFAIQFSPTTKKNPSLWKKLKKSNLYEKHLLNLILEHLIISHTPSCHEIALIEWLDKNNFTKADKSSLYRKYRNSSEDHIDRDIFCIFISMLLNKEKSKIYANPTRSLQEED